MGKTVLGVARSRAQARRLLDAMDAAGFDPARISVLHLSDEVADGPSDLSKQSKREIRLTGIGPLRGTPSLLDALVGPGDNLRRHPRYSARWFVSASICQQPGATTSQCAAATC